MKEVTMSSKNQSSVDWLVSILNKPGLAPVLTDLEIQQAKKLEKEQNRESYDNGYANGQMDLLNG